MYHTLTSISTCRLRGSMRVKANVFCNGVYIKAVIAECKTTER